MKKICVIMVAVIFIVATLCMSLSASAATMLVRGDADGDNSVTSVDVTQIQRKMANYTVETFKSMSADVDRNNTVEIIDATLIQRYLANYANPYNIGSLYDPYELPFIPKT